MKRLPFQWLCLVSLFPTFDLWAGGSGFNVAIVVNQNSTNSVQLGNYYREQRQIPPQNYLRINWAGTNTEWTLTDFNNTLLNAFLTMVASRQLTNQIDYVVLSMDIPYRVSDPVNGDNSTTSALFYGFMGDTNPPCSLALGSSNSYAGSEGIFRLTPPISASSNSFLATMITASNLNLAMQIVSQGVSSDSTFPTQPTILVESTDVIRNIRYTAFDNVIFNTRLRGNYPVQRIDAFTNVALNVLVPTNILGYENGYGFFDTVPNSFVPGAMADNLTSFGGQIFENSSQTPILSFLAAGATGSYGTVTEPCNYPQKFPDPQNYFYQARGFSLAECYYQSITNPYQGLVMGEPLAAPFAQPATGGWSGLSSNAVLSGATNLSLHFTASDAQHPVQQVDLFVDGMLSQTLTNIAPGEGNKLSVTLNGFTTNYTVPAAASISSVASNLTIILNDASFSNATQVAAIAHGDRIEMQSLDIAKTGSQVPISVSAAVGNGSTLTTFVGSSAASFLDTIAFGRQTFTVSNEPQLGDRLQLTLTKTNGTIITVSVTNTVSGTTVSSLTQELINSVNANVALQGSDGLTVKEFLPGDDYGLPLAQFDLDANTAGWQAAQIQVNLSGSATFVITSTGTQELQANLSDLQPRNHLYIAAGVTNLSMIFAFNTTALADGYHELTAVAYEGTHVHTQARIIQNIIIQNTSLSATFTTLVGGTNTALEATLQFAVAASTNNINTIQLFSTGGLLAAVTNQASATFSVMAASLGLGLHPFYALVTDNNGKQYRTPTKWIRFVGLDTPFSLQISAPPPLLVWAAAAGRSYDVLSATDATGNFLARATVIPTNSLGQWLETNEVPTKQFYRVRVTP